MRAIAFVLVALSSLPAIAQPLPEPPDPPEATIARPAPESGPSMRLSVGGGVHTFFDLTMVGSDLSLGVGGAVPIGGWYITIDGFLGQTLAGLRAVQLGPGFYGEFGRGRLRGGVGFHFSPILVDRAAHNDTITVMTFGSYAQGSLDVAEWGRNGGLYLALRGGVDANFTDFTMPTLYASLSLGFRL